jgi:hypothetical protein
MSNKVRAILAQTIALVAFVGFVPITLIILQVDPDLFLLAALIPVVGGALAYRVSRCSNCGSTLFRSQGGVFWPLIFRRRCANCGADIYGS